MARHHRAPIGHRGNRHIAGLIIIISAISLVVIAGAQRRSLCLYAVAAVDDASI